MRRSPAPSRTPLPPLILGLALLLLLSLVAGTGLGAAGIAGTDVLRFLWAGLTGGTVHAGDAAAYTIVWEIRLPRVVLGAVVGAGLASVGVGVQAIVRNALGDPFVLGISSGAAVGANAVILLGAFAALGIWALSVSAFLSALAAMALVYALARSPHGLSPLRLVLTGTALAYGFEAVTTVMVFGAARGEAARSALMWLLGSLGGATWAQVPLVAVTVAAGWAWLRRRAESLNALALGDETSAALGVRPERLRRELFLVTAAVTGTVVAVSGAIGFVGLMVPHVVRMLVGADHRRVLAVAPLVGAVLLVWADVLSRLLLAPAELPVGVITAVVGVPAFLLLMRRGGYAFGGR
ncbi:putative FecCD-family membrane transport protein [Streptomyces scabiei 87.22]|uniref:Putative FecCD-family membrane transport protein n=16 Tax=Streptomyces scabiei TaxID=1930 RepID=C9Z1Z2_STRSW|nr:MULTISPECIES: iron ABC transporter permease [Streptomyces]MBP5859763.1 iron ABC transporter permease [Streptomyces sp. LBUM 1484]MBP5927152.1 iron ABC transporter permease [Streptomyces sp. LBUM 1479]KFG06341.1 sugar ABC transporter substrate-binding protein [Streptomyces scabiei]MBP5879985.1 iron ABC transporter permease [Streptomyces sp. LBUM 1477]MBP5887815.1 iron ABC transporter permease [Streptomyces sp. LBUM 1487]